MLCQGRGSAANSAVCFVLGVTSIDPETKPVTASPCASRQRSFQLRAGLVRSDRQP
ncbi:hypothetical protein EHI43_31950 [Rhizobium leguminosarum]|nr:hypothetical protein EHI43_31950 [Rhizobium leguminosarum]